MAAEPHDADGSLEARVTRLEQRVDHEIPYKVDALAYGLSLVHADVREIRQRVDWVSQVQEQHGAMLEEILRRLPPAADS